eukprot:6319585-Pyramimonas_sp.AAC.1
MWLVLTSGVLYITTYQGTEYYPTAPAISHYTPSTLQPIGNIQSYTPISPPRGRKPRTNQTLIPTCKLTATSNHQTPSRNPTGATNINDTKPDITSYSMTMHYVMVDIFGVLLACLDLAMAYMRGGGLDETRTRGHSWCPAGSVPFRGFVRE